MTSRGKFTLYAAIGLLGGAASSAIVDLVLRLQKGFGSYLVFNLFLGAAFGIMIGVFLGSAEGIVHGNRRKILSGIVVGAVVGAIAGIIGVNLGQKLLLSLLSKAGEENVALVLFIRAVSWAVLGLMIGMVEGIRARSGIKIFYGILGGAAGGFIGGFLLELMGRNSSQYGLSRFLGMLILGGAIGIFYAILEKNFSPGVLRVLNGPLKGKKLALNQRKLTIGESSKNDMALSGYSDVESLHAVITVRGDQVNLEPFRHVYPLVINDEKVQSALLKYQDCIRIGDARFLFEVK